jgi:hypothetical protein
MIDCVPEKIAHTLGIKITVWNIRGECKRTPDEKNCVDSKPEEAIKIVEIIIALARLADALRGAIVLQICGGNAASRVMLTDMNKRMESSGIRIMILNVKSLHMSKYGHINPRVFFTKDLQQYYVYMVFY